MLQNQFHGKISTQFYHNLIKNGGKANFVGIQLLIRHGYLYSRIVGKINNVSVGLISVSVLETLVLLSVGNRWNDSFNFQFCSLFGLKMYFFRENKSFEKFSQGFFRETKKVFTYFFLTVEKKDSILMISFYKLGKLLVISLKSAILHVFNEYVQSLLATFS